MLTRDGVLKDRLAIAGYADTARVEDNQTEEWRRKNRRAEIIILNEPRVKGEPERPASAVPAAAAESSPE